METASNRKSHTLSWTLAVLIGAPLFYFLSVPWVQSISYKKHIQDSKIIEWYITPARITPSLGPLDSIYDPYCEWSWRLFFPSLLMPPYKATLQIRYHP